MKKMLLLVSFILLTLTIVSCKSSSEPSNGKWAKPERVLEGCDGAMSNSKQCQNNPGTQQMMIELKRD